MTTKRAAGYGHSHQQQRRPPDVEEALSSMLWTPYERASNSDSSSEDEDEQLNRQLRKARNQYVYTSLPTIPPSPTPTPPPAPGLVLPATNIVAYIPAPGAAYYAAEDLCDASVTTPLVPFSSLMLGPRAGLVAADAIGPTAATVLDDNCYPNESVLATATSSFASSLAGHKGRCSYASQGGRMPGRSKWWSSAGATHPATDTLGRGGGGGLPADNQQPPSYESLYSKQTRPPAASAAAAASALQRHGKHMSIFRPVLETLKANVTTITQGRFGLISSSSANTTVCCATTTCSPSAPSPSSICSSSSASSSCSATSTASSTSSGPIPAPGQEDSPVNATNMTNNSVPASCNNRIITSNSCNTEPHLVHSFTDDFLTEHCPHSQHVAATNVASTHINNNNNCSTIASQPANNNNTNGSSQHMISHITTTTSAESSQPVRVQQSPQQQEQQHLSRPAMDEAQSLLTHQQLSERDPHHRPMNTKSQQTDMEEEEDIDAGFADDDNDDDDDDDYDDDEAFVNDEPNNNFIFCQPHSPYAISRRMNTLTALQMNSPHRAVAMAREPSIYSPYSPLVYCNSSSSSSASALRVPMYAQPGGGGEISWTRSFEADTSGYGGLARVLPAHTQRSDSYKTGFVGRQATTSSRAEGTTYDLTPNKCLAELERLYAEFRASESLREKRLRENDSTSDADADAPAENMRLNVPAPASGGDKAAITCPESQAPEAAKVHPSTSSVFLTTTNSVTALTNPCQRTPSLTIQVNQHPSELDAGNCNNSNNSNNNHNNNNNNNNINNNHNHNTSAGENTESASKIIVNQATVSATASAKNGVSVINCNYVNAPSKASVSYSNNNNNNNNSGNNKSITNLSDSCSNSNLNTPLPLAADGSVAMAASDAAASASSVASAVPFRSSVPNVLSVESIGCINHANNNNNQVNVAQSVNPCAANGSVNVIQVNGPAASNRAVPKPLAAAPSRTFASAECQTDDVAAVQLRSPRSSLQGNGAGSATLANSREQRRRERRERRHLHHTASMLVASTHAHHAGRHAHLDRHSMPAPPLPPILHPPHMHPGPHNVAMLRPMLPDILHNHFPPPYSALPHPQAMGASGNVPSHPSVPALASFGHASPLPQPPPAGATMLGPPPPPPPAGTTLLTSVISTVPIPGATPMAVSDGRFTLPLPIMRRSPSERSGKGCCGQWFAGPPLRALIAVVALGGVACALAGAALGATGLAGPPSSHFTAALLMIGVGVVLVTVSGAAWRMTAPGGPPCLGLGSSVDLGRCGRRPCSRGGGAPQGLLYPEFQHRPPPPSYQASMQEYRLRLLLLDRDRQNGVVRGSSPPPTYRSHAGSLLRAPLTTTIRGASGLGGSAAAGRGDSSIGGSEYSFPPSYRSRNTTPGTIGSERSIETEPSGRLLANEDIPEPLSVEQLSEFNSLQQRTRQARSSQANGTPASNATTTTQSMMGREAEKEKRKALQLDKNCIITQRDMASSSDKKDDLVTIVTITPQNSENTESLESQNNTTNASDRRESGSREQIEILAHL